MQRTLQKRWCGPANRFWLCNDSNPVKLYGGEYFFVYLLVSMASFSRLTQV